jgi:hypothetical protein
VRLLLLLLLTILHSLSSQGVGDVERRVDESDPRSDCKLYSYLHNFVSCVNNVNHRECSLNARSSSNNSQ